MLHLGYATDRKAYILLTIPNFYREHQVEVRHIHGTFPLKVTDYLSGTIADFRVRGLPRNPSQ